MEKLKPCPFCGGKAKSYYWGGEHHVECDIEVNSADELERLRGELCEKYREHSGVDDVTVLFRVVG